MVFPAYAKNAETINYESKAAFGMWAPIEIEGTTYQFNISYIVSHQHTKDVPVDKKAEGILVFSKIDSESNKFTPIETMPLGKYEYTIPNFSKGSRPTLTTTFLVADNDGGEDIEVLVDVEWRCVDERTTFSHHDPPENMNITYDSYKFTSCPAEAVGSITIIDNPKPPITISDPSSLAIISHFRFVENKPK
jgi:hypothetical protein